MENKYLNLSGNAMVIIKAADNYRVNNRNYIKGQVITTIKDASFLIDYNSLNKTALSKTLNLAFTDFEPRSLTITQKNINRSLADLLFNEKNTNAEFNIPQVEYNKTDISGSIMLNYPAKEDSIFVYNENRDLVTTFIAAENGLIEGLEPHTEYFISYYIKNAQLGTLYSVQKNQLPYFLIEILNEGNIDNTGRNMIITIPKASLEINPSLNFNSGEILGIPLTFNILDGKMFLGFY